MPVMSAPRPLPASRSYAQTAERQATEFVWKAFGQFGERVQRTCCAMDSRNRQWTHVRDSPPALRDEMTEQTDLVELFATCGNMDLNKLLLVFAQLMREMDWLSETAVADFVAPVAVYDGAHLTSFLPVLFDLMCWASRCCDVAANLMRQLCALFGKKSESVSGQPVDVAGVRFDCVLQSLANLSVAVLHVETAVSGNEVLKQDVVRYEREIQSRTSNTDNRGGETRTKTQTTNPKIFTETKLLQSLVSRVVRLFDSGLFSQFAQAMTSATDHRSPLADHFSQLIRSCVHAYSSGVRDDRQWLAVNCLFVHYVWLFRREDQRLLKSLLDAEKKTLTLLCHLPGNVTLIPDRFLAARLPAGMADKRLLQALDAQRLDVMRSASLPKEVSSAQQRTMAWLVDLETQFGEKRDGDGTQDGTQDIPQRLSRQMRVLQDAHELAAGVQSLAQDRVFLHLHHAAAVSRKDLVLVCQCVALTSCVRLALDRRQAAVLSFQSAFAQYHSFVALKALSLLKKRLVAEVRKYSEKKLDVISAVILTCNCLTGAVLTRARQTVASLCSAVVRSEPQCDADMIAVLPALRRLTSCSRLTRRLSDATDAGHVSRTQLLPEWFASGADLSEVGHAMRGLRDCESLLRRAYAHDAERQRAECERFASCVQQLFLTRYADALARDAETELRLQSQSHLLPSESLFSRKVRDLVRPLAHPPLRVAGRTISAAHRVSQHLNETAYNLTCVALHDWKTYEWMLVTGRSRLRLQSFVQTQLPTQTLEQGLDVLQVTRSIHSFVSRFCYNLNNQVFVEKRSDNKHLNVLFIRHVANSIQTHGHGIVNTAVNLTYQFLKQKLHAVSQFLFEQHVQQRLAKDLRSVRQSGAGFPYERAERLVTGIRHSLLDQLRLTVTEIGNALGFVRMLRSGALHCSSAAVHFVPDSDDLPDVRFGELVGDCDAGLTTAAQNLDRVLHSLTSCSSATDFFRLLVLVFADALREQPHLKHLFVVVPALTISHAEHAVLSKQNMHRNRAGAAAFTDDGFAVGVAYLMRLLQQVSDWQSLHWFPAVRRKLSGERTAVASHPDRHTTSLTLKRLAVLQNEFDLLEYNITSCNVLFRS